MAKTPSSTKSESVTLRIPNEVFSQILSYAASSTKGNRSEAIVELIEMGLAVALSQQPTRPDFTVQDTVNKSEVNETVTALAHQVDHLTHLVQDTVLQRLTEVETELMGSPTPESGKLFSQAATGATTRPCLSARTHPFRAKGREAITPCTSVQRQ